MNTSSKQSWTEGNVVKVEFLTLTVKAKVATPGDFAPDAYILVNAAGTQLYKFVPHNGVTKITVAEAQNLLAISRDHAGRVAAGALSKASAQSRATAAISKLSFA